MNNDNDGPFNGPSGATAQAVSSLTLRDYFAARAVAGILASPHLRVQKPADELAQNCYRIADAMLKERSK